MTTRRFFFAATLLAFVIVAVPLYWPSAMPKVTTEALIKLIGKGEAPAILDVRTKSEYNEGHLPEAIHASVFTLFFEHDELAISQQEALIIYCRSGFRARLGALILKLAGYESIYLLEGNLRQWKNEGYPLIVA